MILLITSLVLFWAYNIWTFTTIGIKSSISSTVNYIKRPWIFSAFIFSITVPILIYAAQKSMGMMIAGSLIMWVGFARTIRGKATSMEYKNHGAGALGGILSAYLTFAFEGLIFKDSVLSVDWSNWHLDLFFWAIVAFLVSSFIILPIGNWKKPVKNHTTYVEIAAYVIIILILIINEII